MNNKFAPHSDEAEPAVLGAILLDPATLAEVRRILKPDMFFYLKHQWIYQAMLALGEATDIITLRQKLIDLGKFEEVGGDFYLNGLVIGVVNSFYAVHYAQIIKEYATRRAIISAATQAVNIAADAALEIGDVITQSETAMLNVTSTEREKRGAWVMDVVSDVYDLVIDRLENKEAVGGVPSRLTAIDNITNGWQKSDLVILAARPAMGKSALALLAAVNAAKEGIPTAFFSLEMSKEQLVQRLIAMETGINVTSIRTGRLTESEVPLFMQATDTISHLPLFIDDDPSWNVINFKSECRRLVVNEGVGLIVADYLQLMSGKGGGSNPENRVQEISFISRHLKVTARELNIPIIALSQLSRNLESRADKRPILSDLRESGSIEQDADIVMFIYRDDMYNDDSEYPNQAEIIFAKHRNGATGTARLHFNKALTKFGNLKTERMILPSYAPSNGYHHD